MQTLSLGYWATERESDGEEGGGWGDGGEQQVQHQQGGGEAEGAGLGAPPAQPPAGWKARPGQVAEGEGGLLQRLALTQL